MNQQQKQERMMSVAQAAMAGDEDATARIVAEAAPLLRERYEEIEDHLDQLHGSEWDKSGTRRQVVEGEEWDTCVPKEMTVQAFSSLHKSLLRLLALTPAALLAEEQEEMEEIGEMWNNAMLELLTKLHNPTIRYGIVGGFHPDRQAEVDDYFDRYGREFWGTIEVLTRMDDITPADFPPETQDVLEAQIEAIQEQTAEAN